MVPAPSILARPEHQPRIPGVIKRATHDGLGAVSGPQLTGSRAAVIAVASRIGHAWTAGSAGLGRRSAGKGAVLVKAKCW